MLTLNPTLMSGMTDEHLLASLNCEPSLMRTPVELELIRRCERLMDEFTERPTLCAVDSGITEAIAQYPDEGFLDKLSDRVFDLGEKLKGERRDEAHAIAKELTELGATTANASAYGIETLRSIVK